MSTIGAALRSVEQLPKLEPWPDIIEDLGFPGPVAVGKALGIDPVFVDGWNRAGTAPKWACIALFWLTRWGRAEVHAQAVRDAALAFQCLQSVERERDELRARLGMLPGRTMLSSPQAFESLPFSDAPALARWGDMVSGDRQAAAARFMGGPVASDDVARRVKPGHKGREPLRPQSVHIKTRPG